MIQHSREHISTAPESNGSELTVGIVHGDFRLVCGCSAMETHFMKLMTNNSRADVGEESRGEAICTCVAYHFAAQPLLLLDVSTSQ